MTEDMDSLVFGCPRLIRKSITKLKTNKDDVSIFDLENILKSFDLTHDEFIDLCILCGCDYCSNIPKIGNITAYKLIKKHKNIENVIEEIKNKKYDIPDDYMEKFLISRKLFLIFKNNIDIKKIDIKSSVIDKKKLSEYLSSILDFNKTKIDNLFKNLKI
jgi:flap endonuclease-1